MNSWNYNFNKDGFGEHIGCSDELPLHSSEKKEHPLDYCFPVQLNYNFTHRLLRLFTIRRRSICHVGSF